MAIQYPCEVCHEHVNEMELIGIDGKLMCPACVKFHVQMLMNKVEILEEKLAEALDNSR